MRMHYLMLLSKASKIISLAFITVSTMQASIFCLSQFLTSYFWGLLSDR